MKCLPLAYHRGGLRVLAVPPETTEIKWSFQRELFSSLLHVVLVFSHILQAEKGLREETEQGYRSCVWPRCGFNLRLPPHLPTPI